MSKFYTKNISDNTIDWANFGNYTGGVITPIISYCSFILLGLLTYWVSRNSSKEAFNHQLWIRKNDAYLDLTKRFPHIVTFVNLFNENISLINTKIELGKGVDFIPGYFEEASIGLKKYVVQISEFTSLVNFFKIQYSHLFRYDFDNIDFENFRIEVNSINDKCKQIILKFETIGFRPNATEIDIKDIEGAIAEFTELSEHLDKYKELGAKFLNEIHKELKIN